MSEDPRGVVVIVGPSIPENFRGSQYRRLRRSGRRRIVGPSILEDPRGSPRRRLRRSRRRLPTFFVQGKRATNNTFVTKCSEAPFR